MKLSLVSAVLLLPTWAAAYVGGPCSGSHAANSCICLDKNVCTKTWGGKAVQGRSGDWPCPNDAADVWGCNMQQCMGFFTRCAWKSSCKSWTDDPLCPGGANFVCCFYP
ncbi:hypothetical protein B0T18DRAFT_410104 [Schizothecium vesticola]|uniref:Uncharacterized protein n=1 Tax=Schizothecium vesticola TaxID=314040 RepID=A0AA40K4M5_9PEZI|nr:hypothetical protein B0T18DRAFT_410104 [Schizothecium vesticola]